MSGDEFRGNGRRDGMEGRYGMMVGDHANQKTRVGFESKGGW